MKNALPVIETPKEDTLLVSGDGVFFTKQGEGPTMGAPAIFLRLNECNLRCKFCDTKETWEKSDPGYQERQWWTVEETMRRILMENKERCHRLVLTGGEPFLQQKNLATLCRNEIFRLWNIEIETNGTIMPRYFQGDARVQINCSPKLSNSGIDKDERIRPDVLQVMAKKYWSYFKFVVSTEEDVREIHDEILPILNVDPHTIYLSPEGTDVETLDAVRKRIRKSALRYGFIRGDREHIRKHGNKRRV